MPVCSFPCCINPGVVIDSDGDVVCWECYDGQPPQDLTMGQKALRAFKLGLWFGALGQMLD